MATTSLPQLTDEHMDDDKNLGLQQDKNETTWAVKADYLKPGMEECDEPKDGGKGRLISYVENPFHCCSRLVFTSLFLLGESSDTLGTHSCKQKSAHTRNIIHQL